MRLKHLGLLLLLLNAVSANIWDNIYSATEADTQIRLQDSINFQVKVPQTDVILDVDFNKNLQILTVYAFYNLGMLRLPILTAQLDISTLVLTIKEITSAKCKRFSYYNLKDVKIQQAELSQDKIFLINLFFKFIGKSQSKDWKKTKFNIYQFSPYLLDVDGEKIKQIRKQLKQSSEQFKDIPLDKQQLPQIFLFLHINAQNGAIQQIYAGQNSQQKIPFSTGSKVTKKYDCKSQIKVLTNQDLKQIARKVSDFDPDRIPILP